MVGTFLPERFGDIIENGLRSLKSYAYDPDNPGHKYINSTELDEDLAKCAKEMKKKKVNVLGTDYTICFDVSENEMPVNADGCTDHSTKEIKIAVMKAEQDSLGDLEAYKKQVLRHEIVHAFLFESGLGSNWQHADQFGHEETTVDWIAFQFPKLLKAFKEAECL